MTFFYSSGESKLTHAMEPDDSTTETSQQVYDILVGSHDVYEMV